MVNEKVALPEIGQIQGCENEEETIPGLTVEVKVKAGVLRPVQQPGSYWDRSSALPPVGLEPTDVTACD